MPENAEILIRVMGLLMGVGFGIERFLYAVRSLQSGTTHVRRFLGNQYSSDVNVRGVGVHRSTQPALFMFLISLWFFLALVFVACGLVIVFAPSEWLQAAARAKA